MFSYLFALDYRFERGTLKIEIIYLIYSRNIFNYISYILQNKTLYKKFSR